MPLVLRLRRDPSPGLTTLPKFRVRRVVSVDVMAMLQEPPAIMPRVHIDGHRPYAAYVLDVPAAEV